MYRRTIASSSIYFPSELNLVSLCIEMTAAKSPYTVALDENCLLLLDALKNKNKNNTRTI